MSSTTRTSDAATLLDPAATHDLLTAAGVHLAPQVFVARRDGVGSAAERLGYPVALKAFVPGLLHRAAAGAVRLRLSSGAEVAAALAELAALGGVEGYIVQAMRTGDLEMMVGLRRDPVFGPAVTVAVGGGLVEAIADSSVRLAPVTLDEAIEMITELRVMRSSAMRRRFSDHLLRLAGVVVAASTLGDDRTDIAELDLNPVLVTRDGAVAVDAKVLVSGTTTAPAAERRPAKPLDALLRPRSIAVVGASANPSKQGGRLISYLVKHGYQGALHPVNPNESEVQGLRAVPSVSELPEGVDLACVVVRPDGVKAVVQECAKRGIGAVAVFTSGFAETGPDGAERQRELGDIAARAGIRIMGPNTAGLMDASHHMCAAIGMAFEVDAIRPGHVAVISQSGAIGSALLSRAWEEGIGVGRWICTGNEADVTLGEYMLDAVEDSESSVLVLFVETLRDVATFRAACARARELGKPILVYKAGSSSAGRRVMQTHTGAIAGDDAVCDAALRSFGAIRVPDLQSLLDGASVLSRLPMPAGRRVGVVSASGGACSVVADECARQGLDLAELSEPTLRAIRTLIPPFGVATNPVDVTMEVTVRPSMLGDVARLVLDDAAVDALLVMLTTNADPPAVTVAEGVISAAKGSGKPVVVARLGAQFLAPASLAAYRAADIPVFPMPERAVRALRTLAQAGAL